ISGFLDDKLILSISIFLKIFSVMVSSLADITKNALLTGRISRMDANAGESGPAEGPCFRKNVCPANHIGFFVQSGAANVVPPKICVNNNLALGTVMNNAGSGINIVVVNGKSGEVVKTDHFNMYSGSVEPLIEFLKGVETGSVVLMAVYDEGSTKLNEEARTLISDLGSSTIHSLGYRDNWVFVGGKGTTGKSNFEKHMKSDDSKNKYDNWPEMVEVEGCVPKYVE
uniref:ILEI/PANDER domain-containing protein n=1 Tax=Poecilia formosa TaxID=48698 RepID=A0A087Y2G5_POEFO